MGIPTDVDDNRTKLTDVFNEICDIVEVRPYVNTPFVGKNAGGHKAGVHADGKMKGASYDFYDLTRVGNKPPIVISNQSGTANIVLLAESFGYDIKKSDSRIKALLAEFKRMSDMGYRNGSLEAEQYLLVDECLGNSKMFFSITHHKVVDEDGLSTCELEGKVNGAHDKINTTVRGAQDTINSPIS
ncbi:MAG: 2-isopropylmalate synthase/homocitrate synthase family protein [Parcubacteria group bacterium GW2011_GWF2_46_8]|nr:MAG: 2-isopropylmalate synthase/homocitrate synthase family protein [Parcubacteria group bacterium GW2011_GWF2_46_8]